jgi:hypothetical protein
MGATAGTSNLAGAYRDPQGSITRLSSDGGGALPGQSAHSRKSPVPSAASAK